MSEEAATTWPTSKLFAFSHEFPEVDAGVSALQWAPTTGSARIFPLQPREFQIRRVGLALEVAHACVVANGVILADAFVSFSETTADNSTCLSPDNPAP